MSKRENNKFDNNPAEYKAEPNLRPTEAAESRTTAQSVNSGGASGSSAQSVNNARAAAQQNLREPTTSDQGLFD